MAQSKETIAQRSKIMSKVHRHDTDIELLVRSRLHGERFRFRKNVSSLPGSPDVVLKKYQAVIFVHGCFWHGHQACKLGKRPKTNRDYWLPKIEANMERDEKKYLELQKINWRVAVLWKCALKNSEIDSTITTLVTWLKDKTSLQYLEIPSPTL